MKPDPDSAAPGMTLKQLLIAATSALLLLLLLGSLLANLYNLRQYMQWQLQSHSQDAATSLGLALSTVVQGNDLVMATSMIDAIYDSGYYRQVVLRDLDGNVLIERRAQVKLEDVPAWLVDLIELKTPEGKANVTNGWQQLGTLTVVSHPGFAYRDLWRLVQIQLAWFLVTVLLGYLVIQAVVSMILQPLHRIEEQADAIRERDFTARSPMPKTRELGRVSLAMNSMAERLAQIQSEQLLLIEDLREQTYRDALTGLSNRAEFDKRLRADLESEQSVSVGSLMLLQVEQFADFNQEHGRQQGDALLKVLAEELRKATERHVGTLLARRAGADFAIYVPGLIGEQADQFASDLLKRLARVPMIKQMCRNDVLHLGIATSLQQRSAESLLAEADMALRKAQAAGPNGWQRFLREGESYSPEESVRQASEWLEIIRRVLAQRAVLLHFQPVYGLDRESILHHQVLSRVQVDEQLVVAGIFLPMAERFGLLKEIDQLVMEKLLERMLAEPADTGRYCITLSPSSLAAEGFTDWLLALLQKHRTLARRIVLEVPEYSLHYAAQSVEVLAQGARALGCQLAIDRFGAASIPFSYLQRLPVDFIKVDHSFVRDIQNSRENQFFLRTVIQIAHSQAIQVVAVGVEFEAEWLVMEQLAVDAVMGYYLCRPQETPVKAT